MHNFFGRLDDYFGRIYSKAAHNVDTKSLLKSITVIDELLNISNALINSI